MLDENDEFQSSMMDSWGRALQSLNESTNRVILSFLLVAIITFVIATISFLFGYLASHIEMTVFFKAIFTGLGLPYQPTVNVSEFFKQLFTSLSVGIALFFINHVFVYFIEKLRGKFVVFCIVLSIATLCFSFYTENLLREYTRELGVGIILLVCLEVIYMDWIKKIEAKGSVDTDSGEPPYGATGGPSAVFNPED